MEYSPSSTKGPPGLLIRAPLSSPEEEEEEEAGTPAASLPPTPSPPASSSEEEEEEYFLSGEEEPEAGFETASERPFVTEPDEEAAQDDQLGVGPLSPAFLLKKTPAFVPKARISMEEEDVAEDVFDDGAATDDEGEDEEEEGAVRVSPRQLGAEVLGGVDFGGGIFPEGEEEEEKEEEDGGDDDEKGDGDGVGDSAEASAGRNGVLEVGVEDGLTLSKEKAAAAPILPDGAEDEVGGVGMPHEKPVSDGAAAAESPESVNPGDESAVAEEEVEVEESGEDDHNVGLGHGDEEGTNRDAPAVVTAKSSHGVVTGTEELAAIDGELKVGNIPGSAMEDGKISASKVVLEWEPGDVKSGGDADERGDRSDTVYDNNLEMVGVVIVESEDLQFSETKGNSGNTGEVGVEEKAADSSESGGGIGEFAGNGVLGGEAAESSLQKPDPLSSFDDAGDEVVQVLGTETGECKDHVNLAATEVKSHEANPELIAEESGAHSDPSFGDNLEAASVVDFETRKLQLSGREGAILQSGEGEELTIDSSGGKERDEEVETTDAQKKPVVVSVESDGAYLSSEKNYQMERTVVDDDDVLVLSESKTKINDSSEDTDHEDLHAPNEGGKQSGVARSKIAEQIVKELEAWSLGTNSTYGSSRDCSNEMDVQIVSDSDEEMETDEEGDGKELFDSETLAALLKAATGSSSDGGITTMSTPDATRIFSVDRPAGLGFSAASLKPAPPRPVRPNIFSPSEGAVVADPESSLDEEGKKLQEKIEQLRVKFLRLVHRLGHSPEDRVAAQVLYRLGLAEGIKRGRQIGQLFSFEKAKKRALQLEEDEKETLDFSCNILVIGKTGVGKSATINSIFGEQKVNTDAFEPVTSSVREIIGTVDGIRVCVIDSPGLRSSVMDQAANMRNLASIKKYTKKHPPDIVLYVDRLDTQTCDFNDLPLLRSITSTLGSSIWFNTIIALTHAASAPPDGPNGSPLSYEGFVDQRSRVVQHAIRQASGDMRFMNPVALVENHPSCRRNREGQMILPNGLIWRTQLLLLCFSSKILSDANSLLKLQDMAPGKLFGFRMRSPPLPFLLSSLLQSRVHPKLPTDQGLNNGDSDVDMGELSDSDEEEQEDEYDQLPPFKPLRKAQIAKLTREQRKAYFDEYDYRVKLLQKKQWKEELKRLKEMKKRGKTDNGEPEYGDLVDDYDQDSAPATVPVPLPDMLLPPSFDCDNPAYRYRFLEPTSQLIARPVLDTHGWDHDCGYDGVSLEENLAIAGKFPAGISIQVTKDKKEFSIHLDSSVSAKHGENGSTLTGFDIQSVGKQLAYILRSETKFRTMKNNKTAAGILVTFLGESIATGLKVEDQLTVGKRLGLVASTGAVRAQGDVAYGANLEVRLREKDFPIGQDVSTLGLSLMKWRSDLALGANLQSQLSVGRYTKMAVRLGLNNKLSGQITVRTSTSEQLAIALVGILPIVASIYRSIWSDEAY